MFLIIDVSRIEGSGIIELLDAVSVIEVLKMVSLSLMGLAPADLLVSLLFDMINGLPRRFDCHCDMWGDKMCIMC